MYSVRIPKNRPRDVKAESARRCTVNCGTQSVHWEWHVVLCLQCSIDSAAEYSPKYNWLVVSRFRAVQFQLIQSCAETSCAESGCVELRWTPENSRRTVFWHLPPPHRAWIVLSLYRVEIEKQTKTAVDILDYCRHSFQTKMLKYRYDTTHAESFSSNICHPRDWSKLQ